MNDSPKNSVKLNPEDYIEITIVGDQSYLSFDGLRKELDQCIAHLRAEQKPIIGLIDLAGMSGFSAGSNKAALELLEGLVYDKAALFGGSAAVTEITRLILMATGRSDKAKIFDDRNAALAWLLN